MTVASVFLTSDIWEDRKPSVLSAFARIHKNSLRLLMAFLGLISPVVLYSFIYSESRDHNVLLEVTIALVVFVCYLAIPVAVLENLGPFRAILRTRVLMKGSYFRAFLGLPLLALVEAIIFGPLGLLGWGLLLFLASNAGPIYRLGTFLFLLVGFPVLLSFSLPPLIFLTLNYYHQLAREEKTPTAFNTGGSVGA